jgi:alpha-glucan,water dikinase
MRVEDSRRCLAQLEGEIRAAGGLSSWQVVSPGLKTATGVLRAVILKDVQEEVYQEPTVLLASRITGEEEIPPGVVAIISPDAVDVLSHVSVRARQLKVLFATCFDPDALAAIAQLADSAVKCSIAGDAVEVAPPPSADGAPSAASLATAAHTPGGAGAVALKSYTGSVDKFCLHEEELRALPQPADLCGAKTNNLIASRLVLPADILTPASAVIPFNSLQRTMDDGTNAAVKQRIASALAALPKDHASIGSTLSDLQAALQQLAEPRGMESEVVAAMGKCDGGGDAVDWHGAFATIKRVWASTWNQRAFIACRKASIDPRGIQMSVLVQRIVEAQYAFVLHTVNPTTSDATEMYGEIVVGQGEALVGNAPGRAFGFTCAKQDGAQPVVKSLPSKGTALWGKGWIFRSDSNAEDLPGFAGAGLFDSFPVVEHATSVVAYRKEKLACDTAFAHDLMLKLKDLARVIEEKMGVPQDIEGCFRDGKLYVVQTRPQVGLEC